MALLACALVPLFTRSATAQQNPRLVGFKAGVAVSSTEPVAENTVRGESVSGFTAGITGRLPAGASFAVQGEILFVRKGVDLVAADGTEQLELRTSVLQVPVTLQYLLPIDALPLRVYAGAAFGLPIACSPHSGATGTGVVTQCRLESHAHAGIVAGGLLDIPLGGPVLTLDVRYDLGLNDLRLRSRIGDAFVEELRGFRGFEATVGVGFPVRWSRDRSGPSGP